MSKLLNFSDDGFIVGRLSSPNAVKYYNVLQTRTIPFYNSISKNNTELPTEKDLARMAHDDAMRDGTCGIKAIQRIVASVWEVRYKDALDRMDVQYKDEQANDKETEEQSKARAVKTHKEVIARNDSASAFAWAGSPPKALTIMSGTSFRLLSTESRGWRI